MSDFDDCRRSGITHWIVILAVFNFFSPAGWACRVDASGATAGGIKAFVISPSTGRISIDGSLDEPVWGLSPMIDELIQRQPQPGGKPTERTEVTLLSDAEYLYIGIVAYDSEPEQIIGTLMARDANLGSDDRVEILLDAFCDQRNAYYFATNPSGALVDGLVTDGRLSTEWDGIWQVRTSRTASGWSAEFAIPFKSLSFPAQRDVWGFNVSRTIHRKLEENRLSGARLETDFLQVSESGIIEYQVKPTQGLGLEVRPFFAGEWIYANPTGNDEFDGEPGIDLFYNITPSLKLTGTVNTDFGETEVDERRINLTRFPLFFPEKRTFFLEGASVFNFASVDPQPPGGIPAAGADSYPFFSRRIGLSEGEEVPVDVGVKLTGSVGRTEVGLLSVGTDSTSTVESKDFLVGRFKQQLFEQSYIGMLFTGGHYFPGQSGRTYGADVRFATSRFLGASRNFVATAYGLRSDNDGVSTRDWSYGFTARYPNDKFDAMFVLREIQENFDPGIGFVQRKNVRMTRLAASYNPRPEDFLNIQQMFHDVYFTRFERLDNGKVESWDLYITPIDWHFNSGDSLHSGMDINLRYERLFEPFEISPGVILIPGEYQFNRYKHLIAFANKRPLSGNLSFGWGDYWSGTAREVNANITYKYPPRLTMSFTANQIFADLPEGDFIARIYVANINFSFSPFLSFSNVLQYDNRSKNLGLQSRVRYTLKPGSDIFFVVQQGWIEDEIESNRFEAQDTNIVAKIQYSFRY